MKNSHVMILLGIAGIIAAASIVFMIRGILSQQSKLRQWRAHLRRGDTVRVKGYPDQVYFWTDLGNGWAWVRVFADGMIYKKIHIDELYPPLEDEQ